MAKAFSIRDFMQDARQQDSGSDVYERVSVYDIGLNPRNEYTMSEIEKIKDSIYALGGVQQNVVLVRCPEGADHTYLALDGHRRLAASRELVSEGYAEFEYVPAVIKGQIDADTEEAMLVMMNSTQRNKTDWEKVMEHMRLKEIIPKLKKRQGLDGRTRDIEADMLGVSSGQISIYNTIGTRLNTTLMQFFKDGCVGISLAHSAAQLEPELQQKLADTASLNDGFNEEDIRQLAGSRITEGQMTFGAEGNVNVPESGTFEETQNETVSAMAAVAENVPESGTSEEIQNKLVDAEPPKEKSICYTDNEDEVDSAVDFIFMDFPDEAFDELVEAFRQADNFTDASMAAEVIFNKMLPYEDEFTKIVYRNGYQVEFIQTGEVFCYPVHSFWKSFQKLCTEIDFDSGDMGKTRSESIPASEELPDDTFSGEYTLDTVKQLTKKYKNYCNMAEKEGIRTRLISECRCLLDALELLREKLAERKE